MAIGIDSDICWLTLYGWEQSVQLVGDEAAGDVQVVVAGGELGQHPHPLPPLPLPPGHVTHDVQHQAHCLREPEITQLVRIINQWEWSTINQ